MVMLGVGMLCLAASEAWYGAQAFGTIFVGHPAARADPPQWALLVMGSSSFFLLLALLLAIAPLAMRTTERADRRTRLLGAGLVGAAIVATLAPLPAASLLAAAFAAGALVVLFKGDAQWPSLLALGAALLPVRFALAWLASSFYARASGDGTWTRALAWGTLPFVVGALAAICCAIAVLSPRRAPGQRALDLAT